MTDKEQRDLLIQKVVKEMEEAGKQLDWLKNKKQELLSELKDIEQHIQIKGGFISALSHVLSINHNLAVEAQEARQKS